MSERREICHLARLQMKRVKKPEMMSDRRGIEALFIIIINIIMRREKEKPAIFGAIGALKLSNVMKRYRRPSYSSLPMPTAFV